MPGWDPGRGALDETIGSDRLIALTRADEGRRYFSLDGLRSVVNLTDDLGNEVASYHLDAWGNFRFPSELEDSKNRFAFTGHIYDPETGLYNAKARYFDPKLGRFLTQDSFLGIQDNPPSLHRYLYGYANPLRYVDPDGHQAVDPNAPPDDVVDRKQLSDQMFREIRERQAQEAASDTAPTAEVVTEEDSDGFWQRALDAGANALGWADQKVQQAGDAVTAWFKKKWRTDEQPDAHKVSNAKAIEGLSGTGNEADRRMLAKDNTLIQEGLAEHAGQATKETIYQQGLPAAAGALKFGGKGGKEVFRRISSKGDDVFETISSRRLFERLRGANLDPPNNFPGIDRVNRGRAAGTSLKTIDLTSKRAAKPEQFRQLIRDYVDDVRNFEGPEARNSSELGQLVEAPKLRSRRLELGVQAETLTDVQRKIIVDEARRASTLRRNPVELRVFEIVKD